MDIVLVDTSVWVNFFKAQETASSLFLKDNLENIKIATCPTILQEVLQGVVSDKDFKSITTYFRTMTRLTNNPYELANDAATLYRDLRKKGITIRKPNDCLIATYAIKNKVRLLHDDKDFTFIAQHSDLIL